MPTPTATPVASISATGAMPLASFRLLVGQWATPTFHLVRRCISSEVTWTQWAAVTLEASTPASSSQRTGRMLVRSSQLSTSSTVSERWISWGTSYSRASVAVCRRISGVHM